MNYKQYNKVYFDKDSSKELKKGLELCYNAVKVTLGARGRNVTIHHYNHNQYEQKYAIQNTKDGVTVIKSLYTNIPEMNIGIDLMKQVCDKTVREVGDATTTTVILTYNLYNKITSSISSNTNVYKVKNGVEYALLEIISKLTHYKTDVTSKEELYHIAMISSNGDGNISEIVSDLIEEYGTDCNITIKRSPTNEMIVEKHNGIIIDRGYYSPSLLDKQSDKYKELHNCYVLLTDEEITSIHQIKDVLSYVASNNLSLLLVAKDFKGDVISTIMANKEIGKLTNIMLIKSPDFDLRSYDKMKDIAVTLNCKVISKYEGTTLNDFNRYLNTVDTSHPKEEKIKEYLGYTEKVITYIDKTVITVNNNYTDKVNDRISELYKIIEKEKEMLTIDKDWVIDGIYKRIANLKGSIITLYVNGNSELEINEKIDRIDDCINSVKCAKKEGYVPGGGLMLYYISTTMNVDMGNSDENLGYDIMKEVIKEPMKIIIQNALGEYNFDNTIKPYLTKEVGYNVERNTFENFYKSGIIDAVSAIKTALINSVSMASTLFTTNCVIVNSYLNDN